LESASGLRSSKVSGFVSVARRQAFSDFFQPAALSAFWAASRLNPTGSAADGSKNGDVGGIGPFAAPATRANADSMRAGRSIADRNAVRIAGVVNTCRFARRLKRTAVRVDPG
jgi:hypothetical protein